jgi:hypothetical protein
MVMAAWSRVELREIDEADDLHISLFRDFARMASKQRPHRWCKTAASLLHHFLLVAA